MRSDIPEPIHIVGVAFFLICSAIALVKSKNRSTSFIALSLLLVSVAELMKSQWMFDYLRNFGVSAPLWRAAVQIMCSAAVLSLLESLRSALWGSLWTHTVLRRLGGLIVATSVLMLLLAWMAREEPVRIEHAGGVMPAVYLALFSVPMAIICAYSLLLASQFRHHMTLGRLMAVLVIALFAVDGLSLFVTYMVSTESGGRSDNGILWIALWPATLLVIRGAVSGHQLSAETDQERRVAYVWRSLYGNKFGIRESVKELDMRHRAGLSVAWVMIVQECVDMIAAESTRVPKSDHTSALLLQSIMATPADSKTVSEEPYSVTSVSDIVELSYGLMK